MRNKLDWELRSTPYRKQTTANTPECNGLDVTTPTPFIKRDIHQSQSYRKTLFTPKHTKNAAKLTSVDKVSENRTKMIGHVNKRGWRINHDANIITKRRNALEWDASHGKSRYNG